MNRVLIYFIIILTIFVVCSCSKKTSTLNCSISADMEELPFIINCNSLQHESSQGTDSKLGTLICDDIMFTYDLGSYS